MSQFGSRGAWLAREAALEFQYRGPGVNNMMKGFPGGFFRGVALPLDKVLEAVFGRSY